MLLASEHDVLHIFVIMTIIMAFIHTGTGVHQLHTSTPGSRWMAGAY